MAKKADRRLSANAKANGKTAKRSANDVDSASSEEDFDNIAIDMASDEEEEIDNDDSEGEVEAFPNEDEEEQDDEEDEDPEEEEDDDEDAELLADLQAEEEGSISDDNDTLVNGSTDTLPKIVPGASGYPRTLLPEIDPVYDSDSSTEDAPNTVGNIPMHWYDDLPHIGYDINGKRILKPAKGDELDKFLETMDDPASWTSAHDKLMQQNRQLTDQELDIIKRLYQGQIPDATYDPYEPTVEWFTSKTEVMPLSAAPEPKRRFVPSKWEAKKVMKIVRAIREGRIVPNKQAETKPRFYNIWNDEVDKPREDHPMNISAPKVALPDNSESYNPPEEYLPDEEEQQEWLDADPTDRKRNYLPKKFRSLRLVPAYDNFIKERFERCLDLYLAPRVKKNRLNIDPESLIPKLPSPKDLRPFPTACQVIFRGHESRVRSFSIDPTGLWLVSGDDEGHVKLWEITTGRCVKTWEMSEEDVITGVEWNPSRGLWLFAVLFGETIALISPLDLISEDARVRTKDYALAGFSIEDKAESKVKVKWSRPQSEDWLVTITLPRAHKYITWHRKGDYFATSSTDGDFSSVLIHQLTRHQTQAPFRKTKGQIQRVLFHPIKPLFFAATQQYVRVYNLMKQELVKTLQTGVKWVSSMDLHPLGDNLVIGSYDKKLAWFDMDLSVRPYRTLRYHTQAIRSVAFHRSYPLFASCSDDGTIQVFHGMVYNDLMQNPLIVPVKILRGHQVTSNLGVLDVQFHPTQPWLISSGADSTLRLWT